MNPTSTYDHDLTQQRHLYAWCLQVIGGRTPDQADVEARAFYVRRGPDDAYRELVFHDEAWHWAMLALEGDGYWRTDPDLATPSIAYRAEEQRYRDERSG